MQSEMHKHRLYRHSLQRRPVSFQIFQSQTILNLSVKINTQRETEADDIEDDAKKAGNEATRQLEDDKRSPHMACN